MKSVKDSEKDGGDNEDGERGDGERGEGGESVRVTRVARWRG